MFNRIEKKTSSVNQNLDTVLSLFAKASGSLAFTQALFIKLLQELKSISDISQLSMLISSYEKLLQYNFESPDNERARLLKENLMMKGQIRNLNS